jgi:hypothetical protein
MIKRRRNLMKAGDRFFLRIFFEEKKLEIQKIVSENYRNFELNER